MKKTIKKLIILLLVFTFSDSVIAVSKEFNFWGGWNRPFSKEIDNFDKFCDYYNSDKLTTSGCFNDSFSPTVGGPTFGMDFFLGNIFGKDFFYGISLSYLRIWNYHARYEFKEVMDNGDVEIEPLGSTLHNDVVFIPGYLKLKYRLVDELYIESGIGFIYIDADGTNIGCGGICGDSSSESTKLSVGIDGNEDLGFEFGILYRFKLTEVLGINIFTKMDYTLTSTFYPITNINAGMGLSFRLPETNKPLAKPDKQEKKD